jgi:hypothetical protein
MRFVRKLAEPLARLVGMPAQQPFPVAQPRQDVSLDLSELARGGRGGHGAQAITLCPERAPALLEAAQGVRAGDADDNAVVREKGPSLDPFC